MASSKQEAQEQRMTVCWYCHWGWAKPVADIYTEALRRLEGNNYPLLFGPAHIVWEDENWEDVDWCLEHFDEYVRNLLTPDDVAVVRWSLEELAKLPMDVRAPEPENYDGEHPENFPPTVEVVRVRH